MRQKVPCGVRLVGPLLSASGAVDGLLMSVLSLKKRKRTRWALLIMTVIAGFALSPRVEATDTDGDGMSDKVDTDVYTPSSTFAVPDTCKTPAFSGHGLPVAYPTRLRYGARTVLSHFTDTTQGPYAFSPKAVATDASGEIVVLTPTALYHVDRTNGFRTELSDFSDPDQGPTVDSPGKLAVDASGMILVTDTFGGPSPSGFLFRIDPLSGARTVLSDFADTTQGQMGAFPHDVAVEASGNILVTDLSGLLFRIDPGTGLRAVLSDFSDAGQGPVFAAPSGVAVGEAAGQSNRILVTVTSGYVLGVDPVSGARSVLSDSSDPLQHALPISPIAVAVDDSGGILVVDPGVVRFNGVLVLVHPASGIGQFYSDFAYFPQGPTGQTPLDVAIGASGVIYVVTADDDKLFEITDHVTTSGTILTTGNQKVTVTKSDPDRHRPGSHVAVITDATGGADPAIVWIPGGSVLSGAVGGATIHIAGSSEATVASGSVTIDVVSGPVEIEFSAEAIIEANTTLGPGNSLSFEPATLTFEALSTNTDLVEIFINGIYLTVQPGEAVTFANVEIDVKPGSDPNCFNNNGVGVIPVAILSRFDFDATQVDPASIQLDGQDVRVVGKKSNVQSHAEDVNGDGLRDLVVQIADEDGTYQPGEAIAILTGATFDGTPIQGTDSICIVP